MELHQQVKQARKEARLTQNELANRAQVGRKDISRFENGENVTMKTFLRIVGALPNLRRLDLGFLELSKDPQSEAVPAEPVEPKAAAETTAPSEPASSREMSLLKTLGQLLVEIASGEKKP